MEGGFVNGPLHVLTSLRFYKIIWKIMITHEVKIMFKNTNENLILVRI